MAVQKHQFVIDDNGKKTAVILTIEEYEKLIAEAEEREAIRAYDAAKVANDQAIPFEQAVTEIERGRQWPTRSPFSRSGINPLAFFPWQ